jgi:hypothetical protein
LVPADGGARPEIAGTIDHRGKDDMQEQMTLGVRLADTVGALVARMGPGSPPRLDVDELIDAARERTGLDEPDGVESPPALRPALEALLPSLSREAGLSFAGRVRTRSRILALVERRFHLEDDLRRHPEIDGVALERPVVVVGMPRSGTTLLQNLLTTVPGARWLRPWEIEEPWPEGAGAGHAGTDPRAAAHRRMIERYRRVVPHLDAQHPFDSPAECNDLFMATFVSNRFSVHWRAPTYRRWLEARDRRDRSEVYRHYARQLRRLLWRVPGERWMLKSPHHLRHLEILVETLPSARILHIHRDPRRVMGSLASHITSLRAVNSGRIDRAGVGSFLLQTLPGAAEAAVDARARLDRLAGQPGSEHRIVDVSFGDLVRDPVATVLGAFEELGEPLGEGAETGMQRLLAERPSGGGGHRYDLADYSLTPETVERSFERYSARFGDLW